MSVQDAFLLLFLLSFLLLVVGLLRPSTFARVLGRFATRGKLSLIFGGAMVLSFFLIGVTLGPSSSGKQSPPVVSQITPTPAVRETASATPTASPSPNLQHQELVKSFEQQFLATEKPATQALDKVEKDFASLATGNVSVFDLYTTVRRARQAAEEVRLAYSDLKAPKELPNDIQNLLKEVTDAAKTAYYLKGEALDHALKFLDNKKPSDLDGFKQKIAQATFMMLQGGLTLAQAKQNVGLPLVEE